MLLPVYAVAHEKHGLVIQIQLIPYRNKIKSDLKSAARLGLAEWSQLCLLVLPGGERDAQVDGCPHHALPSWVWVGAEQQKCPRTWTVNHSERGCRDGRKLVTELQSWRPPQGSAGIPGDAARLRLGRQITAVLGARNMWDNTQAQLLQTQAPLFGASRSPGASGVFVVGSRLPPHLACTVVVGSSWFMLQLKRTWNLGVAVSQACLWDYFPRQLLVRAARLQGRRCMWRGKMLSGDSLTSSHTLVNTFFPWPSVAGRSLS